jgi:hypothetical protein
LLTGFTSITRGPVDGAGEGAGGGAGAAFCSACRNCAASATCFCRIAVFFSIIFWRCARRWALRASSSAALSSIFACRNSQPRIQAEHAVTNISQPPTANQSAAHVAEQTERMVLRDAHTAAGAAAGGLLISAMVFSAAAVRCDSLIGASPPRGASFPPAGRLGIAARFAADSRSILALASFAAAARASAASNARCACSHAHAPAL